MTEEIEDALLGRFLEGIEFFLRMPIEQIMEHVKLHKEDTFCSIRHANGQGSMMCTRDGFEARRFQD